MSTATPLDPAPIFAHFRGCHGTELLTAAVCHLGIFERVGESGRSAAELQAELLRELAQGAPRGVGEGVVITEDLPAPSSAERLLGFHRAQQQNELAQWLKAD
jgi:hypothetical protein